MKSLSAAGATTVMHGLVPDAELREKAKLSRVELAERVGVNSQTIGYLERGEYNPSLALAFRFSELFGLPVEKIFVRKQKKRGSGT